MTTILGGVLIVLGAGVVLVAFVGVSCLMVAWVYRSVLLPIEAKAAQAEYARVCDRLRSDAWWFAEDDATRELIADMASPSWNVSQGRERWRRRRAGGGR